MDCPGDVATFSTFHANRNYWLGNVANELCKNTAFASHHIIFRSNKMSFGLKMPQGHFNAGLTSYNSC